MTISQADTQVRSALPQSTLLPAKVRKELIDASKIADDRKRHWTIDEIIARAKRNFPQFFQH